VRPEGLGKLKTFIHIIGFTQRSYKKILRQIYGKHVLEMKEMGESTSGTGMGRVLSNGGAETSGSGTQNCYGVMPMSFGDVASRWRCRNE
jgi:hypothetical protein